MWFSFLKRLFSNSACLLNLLNKEWSLSIAAGLLFFCAFPPLAWAWAGWLALIPLLLISSRLSPRKAARKGLAAGMIAWLSSLFWLTKVTWIGWFILSLYCSLYVMLFAYGSAFFLRGWHWQKKTWQILFFPSFWVVLEFARANLFTGFPWNILAVSQHNYPAILQAAEWGGVYLLSFLIAAASVAVFVFFLSPKTKSNLLFFLSTFGIIILIMIAAYTQAARYREPSAGKGETVLKVALLQLNIPQNLKWHPDWTSEIYQRLEAASLKIFAELKPDLLVWPETVMPDFFRGSQEAEAMLARLRLQNIPVLAGSMDWKETDTDLKYFNSSFLLTTDDSLELFYHKRHLVMFGEYLPWEKWLRLIQRFTPVAESFTPGTEAAVFRLPQGTALAPLICFEDILPGLARDSVRNGGRLLVNQTNDAWFDPLPGSRQHMAHCVFRCIENRTPAVRATNTGLTCFIDNYGRVINSLPLKPLSDSPPFSIVENVTVPGSDMPLTLYTRYGDWFAWLCVVFVLLSFGLLKVQAKARR